MRRLDSEKLDFLEGIEHPEVNIYEAGSRQTDTWSFDDASFSSYCNVAGQHGLYNLSDTIRLQLGQYTGNVALDIAGGANGIALQELLDDGVIETGVVTNILDKRKEKTRRNPDLLHVDGDLIERDTWKKMFSTVMEVSDGEGPSLIMHRPCTPLQHLPIEFYKGAVGLALEWLRPGGVFFTQVPLTVSSSEENCFEVCEVIAERDDIEYIQASEIVTFNYSIVLGKRL